MRNWLRSLLKLLPARTRRPCSRRPSHSLGLEKLEERLVPAFDLVISNASTTGVIHENTGQFTAQAHGAQIAVSDILADLRAGKNVVISNGGIGIEAGNITWQGGANLDISGLGAGKSNLAIGTDPSSTDGSFTFNGLIFDSDGNGLNALGINFSAKHNLTITGIINAGRSSVTLAADVLPSGAGDDGSGTLTLPSFASVTGGAVTLRGADINIDTSANPATITSIAGQVHAFATGLTSPLGITFDAHDNLYIADQGTGKVSKVTPQGVVSTFASGFSFPQGWTFDPQGNLYVANLGTNTVSKVTPQGAVSTFATGFSTPEGLAFDAVGNLYVSNRGGITVSKVTPQGVVSTFATGFATPEGLCFDARGNLYVANLLAGSVNRVTPQGAVLPFASGFGNPVGLAFDALGNLYVASQAAGTVSKVTPAGIVSPYASGFTAPGYLAFDAQDNLYVSDFTDGTVKQVTRGSVTVRSSLPSLPINIGGLDNVVTGVNLTDAELARFNQQGTLFFGDTDQTGDISFVTAAIATDVFARQNASAGKILLDDENGRDPQGHFGLAALTALSITLEAGAGGIVNARPSNAFADLFSFTIILDTPGPIGSSTNRILLGTSAATVTIGNLRAPTGVFLDGGIDLTLAGATVLGGLLDVTATGSLTVAAGANISAGAISLAADVKPDGTGDNGSGTVTIAAGARVTGGTVTLRGADVSIDSSANAATVTATTARVTTLAPGLNAPQGVAVDAQGNLYVVDNGSNSVLKVTPGGVVSTFATGFSGPAGLGFDALGNLYVANGVSGTVSRVTPAGIVSLFASGFRQPVSLAFDPRGNLYVVDANSNRVWLVTPAGVVSTFAFGFIVPLGVACDAAGNLYVSDASSNSVSRVTPQGVVSSFASGFNQPDGLALDAQGNLYVANFGGNTVSKVTPAGVVSTFATGFAAPVARAFDLQGNLYVSNQNGGTLSRVGAGNVTVRSSLASRPISVGGADNAVAGINLTDAELARLSAQGSITFGDANQTGDISFSTVALNATVVVQQALGSSGKVVLDDGLGTGTALDAGSGNIIVRAGTGGISAVNFTNFPELASTGALVLDTFGPVGSTTRRIQIGDSPAVVFLGSHSVPSNAFLYGFGDLNLAGARVNGTLDVITNRSVLVAPWAGITADSINLTAGFHFDGTPNTGTNRLVFGAGSSVAGGTVNLQAVDISVDTSANPASITAVRQQRTIAQGSNTFAGLTIDAQGNLYIANFGDYNITRLTPQGVGTVFAGPFNRPVGVVFDPQGNLYVSNFGDGTISKITPQGAISTFASGFSGPTGLVFDGLGNLYVTNNTTNTISKITPQGFVLAFASSPAFNALQGLASDSLGNLFVANFGANTVLKVTPGGQVSTFADGFHGPLGLALDSQNNLYVSNFLDGTVIQRKPSGERTTIAQGLNGPEGLVFDPQGNLSVANAGDFTVARITSGSVTVRTTIPGEAISVGGADNAVPSGLNLTDAELARISAQGSITFGDDSQTGDISFVTVATNTSVIARQQTGSAGKIVLDDGGSATALDSGGHSITLAGGAGGVVAARPSNTFAEIDAVVFTVDTIGPVGSASNRIQLGASANLVYGGVGGPAPPYPPLGGVGGAGPPRAPASIFLDGLVNLNLADIRVGNGGTLDASTRGNLGVGGSSSVTATTISLAADVKFDGTGDDGHGTLTIATGAMVTGGAVTLRGADVTIDTSASPALVSAATQITSFPTLPSFPRALAYDAQGNLYIANEGNGTISRVTPQGQVSTFVAGIDQPAGLAFDAQGNLYVADNATNVVFKVTPQGQVAGFAEGFGQPLGLAFDAQGNLYVTDANNGMVFKVTPQGNVSTFATGFTLPVELTFDALGNLYVADAALGQVSKVTPQGVVSTFAQGLDRPVGLVFDAQGNLYVSALFAGTITKVPPGGPASTFASGFKQLALNLVFDPQGNLVVAQSTANTLSKVSPAGVVSTFLTGFTATTNLALDAQGNLYVANPNNGTVSKVTPAGVLSTFAQGLNIPAGMVFDAQGNLYVANSGDGTVSKVTPAGVLSTFARGLNGPQGLAFDAVGNLFAANAGNGTVSKVTRQGVVSTFVQGLDRPTGLTFDAVGNLFVGNFGDATVSKVTPQGVVSTFATGLNIPVGLAFDAVGNLLVASAGANVVFQVTPAGVVSTLATVMTFPLYLAVDPKGNIYASNETGSLSRISTGGVTVRSSLASRPISVGGADNAVAGINLTDAELARLSSTRSVTFGDASQTGDITFVTASVTTPLLQALQNSAGPGKIVLDNDTDNALTNHFGSISLTAGTGGIRSINGGSDSIALFASFGSLQFRSGGPVGSLAQPITAEAAYLVNSSINGGLFLEDILNLATGGSITTTGSVNLTLRGDFTTQAGAFRSPVNLIFTSANTQSLDTGGQSFTSLLHKGAGTLVLRSGPLNLTSNLTNAATAGNLDTNDQAVTVKGLTILNGGVYIAGLGAQVFQGGLLVNAGFSGGTGPVSANGVTLAPTGYLVASSSTFTDTGAWTNAGGLFDPNGGTVVLAGVNQIVTGSTTFFNLTKLVIVADTLTFEAGSTQTIFGLLTLQGRSGNLLTLRSSSAGTPWWIDPEGTVALGFLSIKDGGNLGASMLNLSGSTNLGGNSNISFQAGSQSWTGAVSSAWGDPNNWSLGYVPGTADRVTIPAGTPFQPALEAPTTVAGLTIGAGASLNLAGHGLTVSSTFSNQGLFILQGNERLSLPPDRSAGLPAGGQSPLGGKAGPGTWEYTGDGAGGTIVVRDFGAVDYADLVLDDTGATPDTFRVAAPLALTGSFTVLGGAYDAHGFTTSVSGLTTLKGGNYLAGAGAQTLTGGLAIQAGTFTGGAGVVTTTDVSISGGTLQAPSTTLNISGNWALLGGSFTANNGTVALTGNQQRLSGSTTFFNLSKLATTADTLTFAAGATQTVTGTLTLHGAQGRLLKLRSSVPGMQWALQVSRTPSVLFADVQDGTAPGLPITVNHGTSSGNNSNAWFFLP